MKAQRNKLLLNTLGGFVIFFCLISVGAVLGNRADALSLINEGVKAEGVVKGLNTSAPTAGLPNRTIRQSRNNYVTVEFTDNQGKVQLQTTSAYIGWPEYKDLKVGDTVQLVYRSGKPYNVYLRTPLDRLAGSLWGAFLAGAGILVGIAMIVMGLRIRL